MRKIFARREAKRAAVLFKKIDSTLRGHVSAELAAARASLPARAVIFAPSFPAQKRTVRGARLFVDGKSSSGDLRGLLSRAGLPAAHIDLSAIRGKRPEAALRAAILTGARGLVCDAVTDGDLDRIARAALSLRPRPLFVGSAGLARAIARTFPRRLPARRPTATPRPVVTVVGSASPVSRRQADALSRGRPLGRDNLLVRIDWKREPTARDIPKVRRFGRLVARGISQVHYVLTGGETARAVMGARGIRELRLLGEVEPGVPFGMARDGTLICTKAGAFGRPDTLLRCVARLKRETKNA